MSVIIKYVILAVVGYIFGNINFARIFTKIKKENISSSGSGNPGTMNMLRTHGAILGFTTLFFDALKAAIPTFLGLLWFSFSYSNECMVAMLIGGGFAVIGHIYPALYKFKGGKGIACTVGMFAVINPVVALIIFIVSFIFFYFVKIGSLTSFLFIYSFATYETCMKEINSSWIALIIMWFIVALDTFAHRENIKRLISNTERMTSFKEGVKRDVERVRAKKAQRLEHFQDKEEKLEIKYQKKLENKEEAYQKKFEKKSEKITHKYNKKLNKHSKKIKLTSMRYDNKTKKIEKRGEKVAQIWEDLAKKANNKNVENVKANQNDND